jgi:hypothetical protein
MPEKRGPVEVAYLCSIDDLRTICASLNDGQRQYAIICNNEKTVAITYNNGHDDLNSVCFTFPIVAKLNVSHPFLIKLFGEGWPFGEDGLMVCLHIYTSTQIRSGLYLEDDEPKLDGIEDWKKFWTPLKAALIRELESPE